MDLGDWLGRRAALSPERVALIDADRSLRPITYLEWDANANRAARFLLALGVSRGDRVATLASNGVDLLDLWFACGKLGAIFQPLNPRLTLAELDPLLADTTPTVLGFDPEFSARVDSLQASHAFEPVALDRGADPPRRGHSFAERLAFEPTRPPAVDLSPDDPWVLCSTGGTTGRPKSAISSHGNITWNAINTTSGWGLAPDDVAILNAPLFHTGGLNVFTAPMVHIGGTSVVCASFDVDQVYDLLRDAGVTLLFGVPTMFHALLRSRRWEEADWSCLKLVISGGAPCPRSIFQAFFERGVSFRTGYGLTEAGPNTFWLPESWARAKVGSVGVPLFHIDVRIVDDQGRDRADGEVGELLIRGPHVVSGYWNRPEETAAALRGGWLHTGDLASRDGDGHHWIVGRVKDVIISGGENIYPAEVEAILTDHGAVAEAAVVGREDARWGESPIAFVVARAGHEVDPAALLAFASVRLARFKLPREIVVRDSLPRTAAGKVDKFALRRTAAEGGRVVGPDTSEGGGS